MVLYEGEKVLGRVLTKATGKFEVQCLPKPYGIGQSECSNMSELNYSLVTNF